MANPIKVPYPLYPKAERLAVLLDGGDYKTQCYVLSVLAQTAYWNRLTWCQDGNPWFDRDHDVENQAPVKAWLAMHGFSNIQFVNRPTGTQAILCETTQSAVYAIRGSEDWKDWKVNLFKSSVTVTAEGGFHLGYYQSQCECFDLVRKYLEDAKWRGKKLYGCGHSKGGGESCVFWRVLEERTCTLPEIVTTFGSPAVVTKETARNYNLRFGKRYQRFINNNDVVTRLGDSHVGVEHYIDSRGGMDSVRTKWARIKDRFLGRFRDPKDGMSDGLYDHYPFLYILACKRWAKIA